MELSKRSPEEEEAIRADRESTHAIAIIHEPLDPNKDSENVEQCIAASLSDIDRRAKAANMQAFTPQVSCNTSTIGPRVWLTVTIIAQWVDREKLEKMHRQQALMGGPQGGGRG